MNDQESKAALAAAIEAAKAAEYAAREAQESADRLAQGGRRGQEPVVGEGPDRLGGPEGVEEEEEHMKSRLSAEEKARLNEQIDASLRATPEERLKRLSSLQRLYRSAARQRGDSIPPKDLERIAQSRLSRGRRAR